MTDTILHPPRLSDLRQALKVDHPFRITDIIKVFSNEQGYQWFREMVHTYLPQHADDILSKTTNADAIYTFAHHWEIEYFPLLENFVDMIIEDLDGSMDETWLAFQRTVPVRLFGFEINDVHEWAEVLQNRSIRPGIGALTLLIPIMNPYWTDQPGDQLRISWFEACRPAIPDRIIARIPVEGFPLDQINDAFHEHEVPLDKLFRWLVCDTPYNLLNYSYDEEQYMQPVLPWDREEIRYTAEQWAQASPYLDQIFEAIKWVEEDLVNRLDHIIGCIEEAAYLWAHTKTE